MSSEGDGWDGAASQVTPGLMLLSLFAPTKPLQIRGASFIEFVRFAGNVSLPGHWFCITCCWLCLLPATGERTVKAASPKGCEQRRHFNPKPWYRQQLHPEGCLPCPCVQSVHQLCSEATAAVSDIR